MLIEKIAQLPASRLGPTELSELRALGFVRIDPAGMVDLWGHENAEHPSDQRYAGRTFAKRAADYIRRSNNCSFLAGVVGGMIERGTFGGTEIGFFTELSLQLMKPLRIEPSARATPSQPPHLMLVSV